MFGRFFGSFHHEDSDAARFESVSCCASFAALLLFIDTVIAVSIFVSADTAFFLRALPVCALSGVLVLRVLIGNAVPRRSKLLAACI